MPIPTKEAAFVTYVTNFDTRLTASPAVYLVTPAQASAFSDLRRDYTDAVTLADEAKATGVRSAQLTARKAITKSALAPVLRSYYTAIQSSVAISDDLKLAIGVSPRKKPTKIGRPTVRPGMDVVSVVERAIELNIHDSASSAKRGRPTGTVQAFVFYFVGSSYPSDPALWSFAGAATTNKFTLNLPDSVPAGAQVWVCAAWTNKSAEAGPTNLPISVRAQGGGSQQELPAVRLAA